MAGGPAQAVVAMGREFRELPIEAVRESAHNPRRHFDEAGMAQLVDSVSKAGIITPLLVRRTADPGRFEIAAGHRRYRAARRLGLTVLPCIVRPMNDQEFMEVLTIENLQREGVHPLDEAAGYEALMAAPYKMSAEQIAERVGRTVKYIYDSRKLLELTDKAQELFWAGKFEKGHAILLARLAPSDQSKVIGTKTADYSDGGLFEEEHRLYSNLEEGEPEEDGPQIKARSVAEVASWIKRHIRFKVKQADAFLYPETVAAVADAEDEQRKIVEITHEYLATDDVRQAGKERVYGERAWKRADGKDGSDTCGRSVLGVVASGPGQGQAFLVCLNKKKCQVHWPAEVEAAKGGVNSPAAKAAAEREARERKKAEAEAERRKQREAHWKKMLPKIEEAVMAQVRRLPADAAGALGDLLVEAVTAWSAPKKVPVPRGKTAEDLVRYLAAKVLGGRARAWGACEVFPKTAKALGVDLSPYVRLSKDDHPAAGKRQNKARREKED